MSRLHHVQSLGDEAVAIMREVAAQFQRAVPISALEGDNVVTRPARMPCYDGPSVHELLEELPIEPEGEGAGRLPVQWVIDDGEGGSAPTGQLARGGLERGDALVVQLRGAHAAIERIVIGRARIRLEDPVAVDLDRDRRYTGSAVLIPETNVTSGAAMVVGGAAR